MHVNEYQPNAHMYLNLLVIIRYKHFVLHSKGIENVRLCVDVLRVTCNCISLLFKGTSLVKLMTD